MQLFFTLITELCAKAAWQSPSQIIQMSPRGEPFDITAVAFLYAFVVAHSATDIYISDSIPTVRNSAIAVFFTD